jgi:hypothetical protein
MAFLMTVFNIRLGLWMQNPDRVSANVPFTGRGPILGLRALAMELFGKTDANWDYVHLSDGGHFENLGLYELVRRRCRFIVVSDAGQDRGRHFDDLGNAIRKVRIDLGVPIDFTDRISIYPKAVDGKPAAGAAYFAVGRIDYTPVDGKDARPGLLVYVKPAIIEEEPYDVTNYARRSRDFPHETTADQWFSESQFESYRALGKNVLARLIGAGPGAPLFDAGDDPAAKAEALVDAGPAPAAAAPPAAKAAVPAMAKTIEESRAAGITRFAWSGCLIC